MRSVYLILTLFTLVLASVSPPPHRTPNNQLDTMCVQVNGFSRRLALISCNVHCSQCRRLCFHNRVTTTDTTLPLVIQLTTTYTTNYYLAYYPHSLPQAHPHLRCRSLCSQIEQLLPIYQFSTYSPLSNTHNPNSTYINTTIQDVNLIFEDTVISFLKSSEQCSLDADQQVCD